MSWGRRSTHRGSARIRLQGTIPGGECAVVDVTFDSTGLAAGDYFVGLLISSNDPDTPEVTVPVQLTVLESGGDRRRDLHGLTAWKSPSTRR